MSSKFNLETLGKLCGFQTMKTRKSDRLDFHEVSVWNLKKALLLAYEAGVEDEKKNRPNP